MLDKSNQSEIDAAFEDEAWGNMEAILDREMPVKRDKRRFIWWWFGGLLLLLSIGLSFMFYSSTIPEKKEKEIIAKNRNEITKKDNAKSTVLGAASNNLTTKDTQKDLQKPIASIPTKKIDRQIDPIQKQKEQPRTPKVTFNKNNTGIASEFVATTSLVNFTRPTSSGSSFFPLTKTAISSITSTSTLVPSLSFYQKLAVPIRPLPLVPINSIISPNNYAKWHWGLSGTIGSIKLTKINELGIGAFAAYQFTKKWQVQLGLTYSYFRTAALLSAAPDPTTRGQGPFLPEADPNTDSNPVVFPPSEEDDIEEDLIPVEGISLSDLQQAGGIHYLSFPLIIDYKLAEKWSVNLGSTMHLGLSDSYNSFNTINNRFRKWDISSSLSTTYQFHKNIGMRLSYDRSWFEKRKVLNNLNFLDFNPTDNKQYSPLEGRWQLTTFFRF